MREIDLDATAWSTPLDFYSALLLALGAPDWHGSSIPAITDSMIGGEINAVEPPYVVKIHNLAGRSASVIEEVEYAEGAIARAREDWLARYDESVDAYLEIIGGEQARRRASGEVDPEAVAKRAAARVQHEEAFERVRDNLRSYAPLHASQLHFEGFDEKTKAGLKTQGGQGDGEEP